MPFVPSSFIGCKRVAVDSIDEFQNVCYIVEKLRLGSRLE